MPSTSTRSLAAGSWCGGPPPASGSPRSRAAPASGPPEVGKGWSDAYPVPAAPRTVTLPISEFERLLGRPYQAAEVAAVLGRLGFDVGREGDVLQVVVPYRRVDVAIPADVV